MPRGINTPNRLDVSVGFSAAGAIAYYHIKETLKTAGWVVESSSDATTYNSSGDQITSSGSGAGGMSNANSWFVIRSPGLIAGNYLRFCIQMIALATTNSARVKVSKGNAFSGGSPSATQVPSATGEQTVRGGGSDAAPTGQRIWSDATAGTHRCIGIADSYTPYGFMFTHKRTDTTGQSDEARFGLDPVKLPVTVDHSTDDAPYIIHVAGSSANVWDPGDIASLAVSAGSQDPGYSWNQDTTFGTYAILTLGTSGGATAITVPDVASGAGSAAVAAQDPWTTRRGLFPMHYANRTSGLKGKSTLIYALASDWSTTLHLEMVTVENETRAHLSAGAYFIPWGGATPGSGSWTTNTADVWDDSHHHNIDPASVREPGGGVGTPSFAEPGDVQDPVITIISPPLSPGVRPDSIITIEVTDDTSLVRVMILASFDDGTVDVVHDGDDFRKPYLGSANTRSVITDGYRYTIRRDGNWPSSPTLEYIALDAGGNLGELA